MRDMRPEIAGIPMVEPSIAQELEDRSAQCDKLEALFKSRPYEEISPAELSQITTHYQQRISNCRTKRGMTIQNVPRTRTDASGTVHKADGWYLYRPDGKPLGRSADEVIAAGWSTKHGRPFEEEFRLTPATGVSPSQRKTSR